MKSLKCASLNVCGLKRRLLYPEFCEIINDYDIFCVCETKLDRYDVIELNGYKFISQCRKQKYIRKSGGLGVFVRNNLSNYVSLIESDSDYIMWLKISKVAFKTDEDIYVGVVYIPPNDSRFNTADEINLLNVEITTMCVANKYVLLMGDFNARTCNKADFVDTDDFLLRHFNLDDNMDESFKISSKIENHNISKFRVSQDKVINNEGNMLLDTCKKNNLLILNGRCGKDRTSGAMTFRNQSVIDYSIASLQILNFVKNFNVLELDALFSDGHSLIFTNLGFGNELKTKDKVLERNKTRKPKLPEGKKTRFVENLNRNKMQCLHNEIIHAKEYSSNVDKKTVNNICAQFSEIFNDSAKSCNNNNNGSHAKNCFKKAWFGRQCEHSRNEYHRAKKKHAKNPSVASKAHLVNASKNYKRKLNFFIRKHNKNTQKKLRNLKSKNPKNYWKILNSLERKKENKDIEIDVLYNFFKDLNGKNESPDQETETINILIDDDNEILNSHITETEILKCIKNLKNDKACSNDSIINEYIKASAHEMMPLYVAFFNLIFDTGILPDSWLEGIIRPIYKNKGDPHSPENYRPITILSCFGKLFTSILNSRLNKFLNDHNIMEENQAGFRAGYSTTDQIFVLYALTEILKAKKKKLFCSFIDFSKAFDSVWRVGLWMKLLANNINGKLLRIIFNMYKGIKSSVSYNGEESTFFPSFRGLRQGENLSPVLFALFLNDLETFLTDKQCNGVNLEFQSDGIILYLKLFVLLYADDTVIFGTDETEFQKNLDMFFEYTRLWELDINYNKTKIMIFGSRCDQRFRFHLGEHGIDICTDFKYLGVVFSKTRHFYKARKHNIEQAKKAMHVLYKRIRNLNIPLDLQLHLFDHTILPIALYGCEIWAFENTQIIENLHNEFLRHIVCLRKTTPVYMLHAELGRRPIQINIKSRMISFWLSIINGKESKLSKLVYKIMFNEHENGLYDYKWIRCIKDILITVGRPELFKKSSISNPKAVKTSIAQTLSDLYIQEWYEKVNISSKGKQYLLFKDNLNFEKYLINIPKFHYDKIIKFRTGNHRLPIETGRWDDTAVNERKCNLCSKNDIGDEYHYLFSCDFFMDERKQYLKPFFYVRHNILKYQALLTTNNETTLVKLSKFIDIIMKKFAS
ncbi:MAG: reverse transcriptase domain-containing protein [Candidatus Thiodiazotropha taylori]|nr:hypothetical protein [Candidatus Thiodiazotropha taylori]MCW4285574.1 reverse transcriptase domain-containing protein [Candidatus Thiodiazotropha taylori]